jgi:predicted acetyltransferase
MWASPQDLELMGLLPDGLAGRVVEWLWPFGVREVGTPDDRDVLQRLWQLYEHDLSEFRGTTPGPTGVFRQGHLASYPPGDGDTIAYLAEQGDRPVGFALVRGLESDVRVLGEFFVVRSVRRTGVARAFAEHVVRAHPGRWWIAFQDDNEKAARFWRRLGTEVLVDVEEEGRGIPNKPYLPPDRWLRGSVS